MKGLKEYFRKGDPYVLLTSMGLILSLFMVVYFMSIILVKGLSIFWPGDLELVKMNNGKVYLGEYWASDVNKSTHPDGTITETDKVQYKIGNRDIYGFDFIWLDKDEISETGYPDSATIIERKEYGNFYGFIRSVETGDEVFDKSNCGDLLDKADKILSVSQELENHLKDFNSKLNRIISPLNDVKREISLLKIKERNKEEETTLAQLQDEEKQLETSIEPEKEKVSAEISEISNKIATLKITVSTGDGRTKTFGFDEIVSLNQPNDMNVFTKAAHYAGNIWTFVSGEPRESNTEGGVFPAIFGTVLMVLLMSVLVVPFGILAAIYLNEYAKQGPVTRMIRLSVNNLAGVPSIVYGIFGLGFFIYMIGGSIDTFFFSDKLPEPTFGTGGILWASLTLALLTLPVVVVATEEGILAVPRANKEGALALGATKWQMIRKIVLPNAMPGILTGLILAISRGAGEVAPLMITGVVKLAPAMPLDGTFPFFHLDRKFMHLGFHIYDVGFQSPNVEAAKPMVYSTALLLILIVVFLNLLAIYLRNRMRKKYKTSSF